MYAAASEAQASTDDGTSGASAGSSTSGASSEDDVVDAEIVDEDK